MLCFPWQFGVGNSLMSTRVLFSTRCTPLGAMRRWQPFTEGLVTVTTTSRSVS